MNLRKNILGLAISAILMPATSVAATTFEVYSSVNSGGSSDGSALAAALLTPGGGISLIDGSSQFQGRFDGMSTVDGADFGGGDGYGGPIDGPFFGDEGGDFGEGGGFNETIGSAAFFTDLNVNNFNSAGSKTIIDLASGILLSSGNADIAITNTDSGFSGTASAVGDAGLDVLLENRLPGGPTSSDATVLAFDFTVADGINAVSLDIAFGSEEFPEFADLFPEIAAVFVDGVNIAAFNNGDLLTVTSDNIDSGNFFDNSTGDFNLEYDGISQTLTVSGLLGDPVDGVHSLKLAVSDTSDFILDSGLFAANLQGLTFVGGDPDDPMLPGNSGNSTGGFEFTLDVGDAGVGIDPAFPIFIDPDVATGYTYVVTGSSFATVFIPAASSFGDGLYDVFVLNPNTGLYQLAISGLGVDISFDFLALALGFDITNFQIQGIETNALLDPNDPNAFVTGLTFTNGGTINVTQTAITEFVNVPEPGTILLLGGGLLIMVKRKNINLVRS